MAKVLSAMLALVLFGAGIALAADDSGSQPDDSGQPGELAASPLPTGAEEIPAKRTATSRTFQLPDGSREVRLYQAPVNYHDEDGDWLPIEEGLEGKDGSALSNGESSFDLVAPARLGDGPVRFSNDGAWVASRLLGDQSAPVDLEKDGTATYQLSPQTSVELSTLANGVKENIEIASPSAPSSFHFELTASAGVTPALLDDGSIEFRDQDDNLVAELPAPFMFDSSKSPDGFSTEVEYELEPKDSGSWRLTVAASNEWLNDPGRSWPVTIDPSIVAPYSGNDCILYDAGMQNNNLCASSGWPQLVALAWYPTSGYQIGRSIVNFNLNAIPANADVIDASLTLYSQSVAYNTSGVQVRRLTSAWGNTATWNCGYYSGPTCIPWKKAGGDFTEEGSEVLTSERGNQVGPWTFNGLEPLVQGWVSNSILRAGLLMKLKDEAPPVPGTGRTTEFRSSAAPIAAQRPYLSVSYYPQVPASANAKLISPVDGTKTAKRLKLQASWSSGITSITWQYREGKEGPFKEVPPAAVRDGEGNAIGSWPVSAGTSPSKPLYLDATQLSPTLQKKGGSVQVRAFFEGGKEGVTLPVETTLDPALGGPKDATAPVGPGSVDLLTGNFTVSRTDVSIPTFNSSLDFSRSFNSRDAANPASTGLLGPGWKLGVPVEENGAGEWASIKFNEESETEDGVTYTYAWADAIGIEGAKVPFDKLEGANTYVTPDELPGWSLSKPNASEFVLMTPDGTKTTFNNSSSPNPAEYLPVEVSQPGASSNSTRMVYEVKGGKRRLTMAVAPSVPGMSCVSNPVATTGCKMLIFNYAEAGTWGAEAALGARLSWVTYHAPGNGGPWAVAQYVYDKKTGRLKEVWDPRIEPLLKETYTYNGTGQIETITPPGLKPWTMNYGTLNEEEVAGRLLSVERDSLVEGMAKTTIAYGVPLSGSGLPSMTPTDVAEWGQIDAPLDATAIFPPDQEPASPPTDYSRATIYYMDGDGYAVNTSTPGGGGTGKPSISTSETDRYGNVVRELTPQNRVRALAKETVKEKEALSHKLETRWLYDDEGTEMAEEIGPVHPVRIQEGALAGQVVEAHSYRHVDYDEVPVGVTLPTPAPHLPTTEQTSAMLSSNGSRHDTRVSKTEYGDWKLRKPTKTIVDAGTGPGDLNIESVTAYDKDTGLPVEMRQPSNPGGGGPGTTKTVYYKRFQPGCENAAYAGLPCLIEPAAQPGTAGQPEIKVTKIAAYNALGQPTEVWEAPGKAALEAGTPRRTTVTTYDGAGRTLTVKRTGGGATVPKVKFEYSSSTGAQTAQRFDCASGGCEGSDDQAVSTEYDALGRATSYTDADGNTSTVSYDLLGRPVTTYDGKGTQTRTYDPTSGLLVKLEDSAAGTFTAGYDADGNMVEEGLPNGLVAEQTYDEAGQLTDLVYDQAGNTWLDFSTARSISGQIIKQTGTMSSQEYSYDDAGRLIQTNDTPSGGNCVTRKYKYDVNSNRESLGTMTGVGSSCNTGTDSTPDTYSYDAADRLIGEGIAYDDFGRITSLPAVYAGGKTLSTSYFSTDMVAQQAQDGVTNTFQLDASLRQRQRTQGGGLEGVEVFHYAGGSDTPVWTQLGAKWSRNISGIGGGVGAIQDSASGTLLQLTNPHGDVVATATLSPSDTEPVATFEQDEFGVPKLGGTQQFGWLGRHGRRTEFASGVIQMGVRSYVPTLGRFLSPDPILGGSANPYDYANQDPVNNFDLAGEECESPDSAWAKKCKKINTKIKKKEKAFRAAFKKLRKMIRHARAEGRQNLDYLPDLPVPTTPGEFFDAIGDAVHDIDEATSCTVGGGSMAGTGEVLQHAGPKVFGTASKIGAQAVKVGRSMTGWGAAIGLAGLWGIC